jgi:hypothetical protein
MRVASGEETTALRSELNGLCFDDPEEEDDADGEQDKERKGDNVCKGARPAAYQYEIIFARIPEYSGD